MANPHELELTTLLQEREGLILERDKRLRVLASMQGRVQVEMSRLLKIHERMAELEDLEKNLLRAKTEVDIVAPKIA